MARGRMLATMVAVTGLAGFAQRYFQRALRTQLIVRP